MPGFRGGKDQTSRSIERRSVRERIASMPSTSISLTFKRRSWSLLSVLSCSTCTHFYDDANAQGGAMIPRQ